MPPELVAVQAKSHSSYQVECRGYSASGAAEIAGWLNQPSARSLGISMTTAAPHARKS
jgi:hypothetical protein